MSGQDLEHWDQVRSDSLCVILCNPSQGGPEKSVEAFPSSLHVVPKLLLHILRKVLYSLFSFFLWRSDTHMFVEGYLAVGPVMHLQLKVFTIIIF